MTIVYISLPFYADCDFPLIKELRKQGCKIIHIIPITPQCLKSTLINIPTQNPNPGIFKATLYKEIAIYSDYIDSQDTYVINRPYTSKHIFKRLKSTFQLYRFIKHLNPDFIWTTTPFGISDFMLYLFKNNILTIHDPFPHTGEHSIRKYISEKIAFIGFKKLILLNKTQANTFIKTYHIKPSTLLINKLGTYDCITTFTPTNLQQKDNPYVLFYGRISPYKGIEYLLESFVMIHEKAPQLHLIIAGNGDFYFDISPYKNLSYIEFRNYHINMNETAELFKKALFVVCPYIDATQSGVIMTAYTMNKTVITTNVGALAEYVINNKTGIVIEHSNTKQLYDSILYLYEHPKILNELEENIVHYYKEGEFSWHNIAKKYINLFKSIIN